MNVLVIAPHPDDEAIGCGGAICLHALAGDRIAVVFLTSGELGLKSLARDKAWNVREAEAKKAAEILSVASLDFLRLPDWTAGDHVERGGELLRPILKREAPELIYLPHPAEWHPDHKAAMEILKAAVTAKALTAVLRGYEVWTALPEYDDIENISKVMQRKLRAVKCHRSQVRTWDYPKAVAGLNQYRGIMAGQCEYAEVFRKLVLPGPEKAGRRTR